VAAGQAHFRSGSVSTYEKFRYGKFVTRMKAPDRKGTVSSFFTYWDGPNFNPLEWNELDMEIVPSVEENPFSMNIIYGDGHDKLESHDYAHQFNPHNDWHTYEMEWTPHYISWLVDGHEMRHVNLHDPAVSHLDKAQSLRMNFWTPTFHSWSAGFHPVDMPWYVLYDYVEVFTYDQEHNEFKLHWRDDFDSFDSGKWHKAAGGFESNSSVFHPENVYTSGGQLVLKMEPEHAHPVYVETRHHLREAFEMDLDHRQSHDLHRPHMNDFESDDDSDFSGRDGYHHGDVEHHDDYFRGHHGDVYVDHHDVLGEHYAEDIRLGHDSHDTYEGDVESHGYEGGRLAGHQYGDREMLDHHAVHHREHHDDYHRGEHGDLYVDHHDVIGTDYSADYRLGHRARHHSRRHAADEHVVHDDYDHGYKMP